MTRDEFAHLQKFDRIEVQWRDICEDPTGNPANATAARRMSIGLFLEVKEDRGIESLVTSTTIDDITDQSGYCIYPIGCVEKVKVVRRVSGKRKKKALNESVGDTGNTQQVHRIPPVCPGDLEAVEGK